MAHKKTSFQDLNLSNTFLFAAGRGLYRYTFTQRCGEEDFPLEDGTTRIFINTKGKNRAYVIVGECNDF